MYRSSQSVRAATCLHSISTTNAFFSHVLRSHRRIFCGNSALVVPSYALFLSTALTESRYHRETKPLSQAATSRNCISEVPRAYQAFCVSSRESSERRSCACPQNASGRPLPRQRVTPDLRAYQWSAYYNQICRSIATSFLMQTPISTQYPVPLSPKPRRSLQNASWTPKMSASKPMRPLRSKPGRGSCYTRTQRLLKQFNSLC